MRNSGYSYSPKRFVVQHNRANFFGPAFMPGLPKKIKQRNAFFCSPAPLPPRSEKLLPCSWPTLLLLQSPFCTYTQLLLTICGSFPVMKARFFRNTGCVNYVVKSKL